MPWAYNSFLRNKGPFHARQEMFDVLAVFLLQHNLLNRV